MSEIVLLPRAFAHANSWRRASCCALIAIAALTAAGCHKKAKPRVPRSTRVSRPARAAQPAIEARIGATERGIASWYGYPYHGRRAANGEIYDMEKLTAAHRTLPFETWIDVRNLTNGKSVKVRITDRGPFIEGRIVDLSKAAARIVDLIGPGVAEVLLTVIAPPASAVPPPAEPVPADVFAVQVGAFREQERADALRAELARRFGIASILPMAGDPPMWRVLVGRAATLDAASVLLEKVLQAAPGAAFVVRLDP
jgi:rare lipoprotein A